jgi:hypothetical protein
MGVHCKGLTGQTPLSGRVDVNSRDVNGRTPLSWAVGPCYPENPIHGQATSYKFSHWAGEEGDLDIVKALLDCPTLDARIPDLFGHAPMWWAQTYSYYQRKLRKNRHPNSRLPTRFPVDNNHHAEFIELLADHMLSKYDSDVNAILPIDDDTLWRET